MPKLSETIKNRGFWRWDIASCITSAAFAVGLYQIRDDLYSFAKITSGIIDIESQAVLFAVLLICYFVYVQSKCPGTIVYAASRVFVTYALGARFTALFIIGLISILDENYRYLFLLYGVYFFSLIAFSLFPFYHIAMFRIARVAMDSFLAYLAIRDFGGFGSPLILLLFIPTCTFARRYSGMAGILIPTVTILVLICRLFYKGMLGPEGHATWPSFAMNSQGIKFLWDPETMPTTIIVLGFCLIVSFIIICSVFYVERNRTFYKIFSNYAKFTKSEVGFAEALRSMIEFFNCEAVLFVYEEDVYAITYHENRIKYSQYKSNEADDYYQFIRFNLPSFDDGFDGRVAKDMLSKLQSGEILQNEHVNINAKYIAYSLSDVNSWVMLINHRTNNNISIKPFTRKLWLQLQVFSTALLLEFIKSQTQTRVKY